MDASRRLSLAWGSSARHQRDSLGFLPYRSCTLFVRMLSSVRSCLYVLIPAVVCIQPQLASTAACKEHCQRTIRATVYFGSTAELPGSSNIKRVPGEQQAGLLAQSLGPRREQSRTTQSKDLAGRGDMKFGHQEGSGRFCFSPRTRVNSNVCSHSTTSCRFLQ